jgi:hypothetical protein
MTGTTRTDLERRRRRQARVMRAINVPMRWVLALPFPTPLDGRLMLLYSTGRRTGRKYRQPLSYVKIGDAMLTPGGGNWKLNLRPGERTRLRIRGKDVLVRPDLIGDPDEVELTLDAMAQANPRLLKFVPIPRGGDGRLEPEALANAIRHGFRIVRWRPTT